MIVHLLCLTLALAINKSASQTMTAKPTTCISAGKLVTLRCDTNDTASTILFYLNGINKGGCFSGTCNTGIAGYVQPTQSGTFTDMIITEYDNSRDGGSWTCSYGSSTSDPYTVELENCKSDENSNGKTLKIVAGVLGGVGGAGAAAGLVVGGSKLIKKQASVKNSEEDKSNKNSKEDESKKNSKEDESKKNSKEDESKKNSKEDKSKKDSKKRKSKNEKDKTDADNAEGGRSSAAADSTGVKADGKMERENLKNQNSAEENQKVEYINEERLKNTHSDKDTRKEKPNDSSFSFAVGERGPPPNPQIPPARLEPLKPKKEKSKREKKDAEENSNI